jgi:hypothetical protein
MVLNSPNAFVEKIGFKIGFRKVPHNDPGHETLLLRVQTKRTPMFCLISAGHANSQLPIYCLL